MASRKRNNPFESRENDEGWSDKRTAFIAQENTELAHTNVATTYTVGEDDYTVSCTGTFTVTLPTAVGVEGKVYEIKNAGTGTITLATTSSQTIDDQTTQTLIQYEALTVCSDGANWEVL